MIKPEYLFIWILLHLSAVEFPRKLKKQSTIPVPAAEHVIHARYKRAITLYKNLSEIKVGEELKAHAFALGKLNQYDSSLTEYKLWMTQYPDQVAAADLLNVIDVALSANQKQFADSLIAVVKTTDYSYGAIYSEFSDTSFLTAQTALLKNVETFVIPVPDTMDTYGLVFGPNKTYYHSRVFRAGGLKSTISPADDKPFPSIMVMDSLNVEMGLSGEFYEALPPTSFKEVHFANSNGDVYVTKSAKWVSNDDKFNLEIYRRYYDPRLSKVVEKNVGINAIEHSVSDISFSPSGKNAMYCSDALGGSGKSDIYSADVIIDSITGRVLLQNPVNLGTKVNTLMTECSPFYITDNIIAFSSNGHIGFGGKDIYFYNLASTELRNAGGAINSSFDEYFPSYNQKRFYFSSNRLGEFKNRIYGCEITEELLDSFLLPVVLNVEEISPIMDTSIMLDTIPLLKTNEDSLNAVLSNQQIDFVWYHPQNDLKIDAKHQFEIDSMLRLLRKFPQWKLEIRSYTDSRGAADKNISLSQKRAAFIADLLIVLGVDKERIEYYGLGEASPVNQCVDGVPCTEEEYNLNRRTEITLNPKPTEIK